MKVTSLSMAYPCWCAPLRRILSNAIGWQHVCYWHHSGHWEARQAKPLVTQRRHHNEKRADGPVVLPLNNICLIWAKRAARADIVAIFCCLAVIPPELVQRKDGNVTRLAIVICELLHCAPCDRQTTVHIAAFRRGNAPRLFQGRLGLAVQPGWFRTQSLRVGGRNAESE
jgi:hypothetical protein